MQKERRKEEKKKENEENEGKKKHTYFSFAVVNASFFSCSSSSSSSSNFRFGIGFSFLMLGVGFGLSTGFDGAVLRLVRILPELLTFDVAGLLKFTVLGWLALALNELELLCGFVLKEWVLGSDFTCVAGLIITLFVFVFGIIFCRVVISSPFLFPNVIFCVIGGNSSCFDGVNLVISFSCNRGECSCLIV